MMGLGIVYPIGAVLQGTIANHTGVRTVTVVGAAIMMATMAAIAVFHPSTFMALGDTPATSGTAVPDTAVPGTVTAGPPVVRSPVSIYPTEERP
jgi:predicted MFS family arabinose efflux permease